HREQRLTVNLEPVDAVLGLDVELVRVGLGQDPLHRGGDHPVPMRIPEDHHAATDDGVADEVPGVQPADADRAPLAAMVADLARSNADHRLDSSKIVREVVRGVTHFCYPLAVPASRGTEGASPPSGDAIDAIYDQVRRRMPSGARGAAHPTSAVACVLWRQAPAGPPGAVEVYLAQRAGAQPFFGGFWWFAGGRVEAGETA